VLDTRIKDGEAKLEKRNVREKEMKKDTETPEGV